MTAAEITGARIIQIMPLPTGWHQDEHNRVIGLALVEIYTADATITETYFLGADGGIVHAPDDVHYSAHFDPDNKKFAIYDGTTIGNDE